MKQQSLFKKRKKKRGAKWGRPPSTFTGGRQKREAFSSKHPLHVTLRLREGLPNLRSREGAQLVKHAILGAQACGIRVIHFAILSNHIHLIVEGKNPQVFYNAMKSFCSRLAINLRQWACDSVVKQLDQIGLGIFRGRYDMQILKTPQQVKNALKYVLLNPAKHFKKAPYIDLFTSGALFESWKKLIGKELPRTELLQRLKEALDFLSQAQLWLTDVGWTGAKG